MNYWFFISTQRKLNGVLMPAEDILSTRLADGFWGLGELTPNRRALRNSGSLTSKAVSSNCRKEIST
jgi:hypothetical protein